MAWHSINRDVYHTNAACTEGNNIEPQYRQSGTGNKRKCQRCKELDGY